MALLSLAGPRRIGLAISLAGSIGTTSASPVFIDIGVHATQVDARIANEGAWRSTNDAGLHLGIGASQRVGTRSEIGVRLDLDDIDSNLLIAVRAMDFRWHFSDRLAVGGFVGAARLDLATPAYGYYLGGSLTLKDLRPNWNLDISLRLGDKVARDNLLQSDPQGGSPDNFYDITGVGVSLQRRF